MKQSRATSFLKSVVSTAVGFGVAMIANALVLPLFGYTPSLKENFLITCIYTVISVARGYALERLFEAMGWRTRMSAFALAVLAELQRQRTHEGYTEEHDTQHSPRELARAGAAYFIGAERVSITDPGGGTLPIKIGGYALWPWSYDSWKPRELRRDLVRGTALGMAAGELADRQRKRRPESVVTQLSSASPDHQKERAASA